MKIVREFDFIEYSHLMNRIKSFDLKFTGYLVLH